MPTCAARLPVSDGKVTERSRWSIRMRTCPRSPGIAPRPGTDAAPASPARAIGPTPSRLPQPNRNSRRRGDLDSRASSNCVDFAQAGELMQLRGHILVAQRAPRVLRHAQPFDQQREPRAVAALHAGQDR